MTEKELKVRIIHKHDTEANWLKASGFIPRQGEIIVYDIDANHQYERFKIGDGVSNVNALSFTLDTYNLENPQFVCQPTQPTNTSVLWIDPNDNSGDRYTLTTSDKESIARLVIEILGGNPIFGYVDENNHIVVQGNLANGTYYVKYEMEDGSTINIGNLVLDNNIYYSITSNLINCISDNNITSIIEDESYSATITAKDGYELKSVSVTMGGAPVTVSGGVIDISNVTGNIVITAVAEEIKAAYTNLADPTSTDWADGKRFNGSGALTNVDAGVNGATTNYIGGDLATGDVIRIKGIDLTTYRTVVYDKNKNIASVGTLAGQTTYFSDITVNSTGASFKIKSGMPSGGYIRFCGPLNGTSADVIITKNEEIA